MLQRIDKPLYWDDLESAYMQYKKEHGFLSEDEVAKKGKDIIGLYFKNTMLRQNRDKSFADSEKDGFIHNNGNSTNQEKDRIIKKYMSASSDDISSKEQYAKKEIVEEPIVSSKKKDFVVTDDMITLFGEGYTKTEYMKMYQKYSEMKQTYVIQTSIHKEALVLICQ